jgi:ABC-type multidrug transport system fused ATPase/permease subunit
VLILEGLRPKSIQGGIRFENVAFSYPTRKDSPIFTDLSFEIKPGQTVAFVGGSGSGKSTIAQILIRFYDPNSGSVYIDDFKLDTLDPSHIRNAHIGLVSQEPILFATSIKENIRYGCPDATDEEVIEAAKKANAHNFILSFANGYDTFAGERGASLSGISHLTQAAKSSELRSRAHCSKIHRSCSWMKQLPRSIHSLSS